MGILTTILRLGTAQERYNYYFLHTPFLSHFLELCIYSYPNPLDEPAPLPAKFLLLLVTGTFEYVILAGAADLLENLLSSIQWLIGHGVLFSDLEARDKFYDQILQLFFTASFVLRLRDSGWQRLRGLNEKHRIRPLSLAQVAAFAFWANPGLVCHGAVAAICRGWDSEPLRIRTVKLFRLLMGPGWEFWMPISLFRGDTETAKKEFEEMGKPHLDMGWIAYTALTITLSEMVVRAIPSVVIHATLMGHNTVFWSSARHHHPNRSTLVRRLENFTRSKPFITLQRFVLRIDLLVSETARSILGRLSRLIRRIAYLTAIPFERYSTSQGHDSQQAPRAVYKPGSIRLLKIHPSGLNNGQIICELQWYEGGKTPPYKAVSYAWGTGSPTHEILVDGELTRVTKSAFQVLVSVRSRWRSETIWIDAICIKQEGPEAKRDKELQIPQMPSIYGGANEVIVWLGPSKTATLAVNLVHRIFLMNRVRPALVNQFYYEIPTDAARALKRMLTRLWFRRVWIVQEIVLAKKVTVRYGDESIDWQRLGWFTESGFQEKYYLKLLSVRIGYSGLDGIVSLRNMSMMHRLKLLQDEETQLSLLFYLLQMHRSDSRFYAKIPQDRVYGLFGLAKPSSSCLSPNYEKPDHQLYIDVVDHLLSSSPGSHRLDFLAHAGLGYRPLTPDLPSWAPDWTIRPSVRPLVGTEGRAELLECPKIDNLLKDAAALATYGVDDSTPMEEKDTNRGIALQKARDIKDQILASLYDATRNTVPGPIIRVGAILELQGSIFDRIRVVFSEFNATTLQDAMRALYNWGLLLQTLSPGLSRYPTAPAVTEAFIRTISGDISETEIDYTFTTAPKRGPLGVCPDTLWSCLRYHSYLDAFPAPARTKLNEFVQKYISICSGRVFGVTERGYMGLFLPGSKANDHVCLIYGARVPFNLRLIDAANGHDNTYQLVGPAYIQGIMDGEAIVEGQPVESFKLV